MLLITVDTLRADHLGCYGYALARTPAMDRLARDGVRCSDAISAAPITMPSHTSILTGLYPPAHGVRDNGAYALADAVTTLPERLQAHGYQTQAFVSAVVLAKRYNLTQGFDGYDDDLWSEDTPPLFMIRDRPAAKTAARVVAWLTRWHSQPEPPPFFVWVHLFDPHQPYEPRLVDRLFVPTAYDAEIAGADRGIGTILDTLTALGVLDDTLVVFTADHGESLDEHHEKTHGVFIYDATVHVPLILRYPRLLPRGSTYAAPVRSVDIVPTVLAMLGLPGAEQTQGVSLLRALQGRDRAPELPQYSESLLSEVGFGMAPLYAVRRDGFKWIRAPTPELYDLRADPGELHNLYPSQPARWHQLDRDLDAILADSQRVAVAAADNPMDQETEDNLQALGYLAPSAVRTNMAGIDPKDGIALYNQLDDARHQAQHGEWAAAEHGLRALLDTTPANTTARNILALTLLRQAKHAEAEAEYRHSLAVDPHQYRVHAMLGALALRRGDLDAAESRYRQALDITPHFVEAMASLGFIAMARGDSAAAQAWYERAIAADPTFPHAYRRAADLFYERGDFVQALAFYRKTLDVVPDHFEALVQAGNSARYSGDPRTATDFYERAARLRPDAWIPDYNRACLQATGGAPDDALASLREAIGKGFRQPRLLQENDDFAAIRPLPAFATLVASAGAPHAATHSQHDARVDP